MTSRNLLVVLALCSLLASPARADEPRAQEPRAQLSKGKTKATTEAVIEIDAPPARVYALATDYANWKEMLSDVKDSHVKAGSARETAKVKFTSRALEHTVTVEFANIKDQAIRFVLVDGPPGARARGEYVLEPTADGQRTIVRATLYVDVKGAAGWFVTDSKVRKMRERKLRADLEDMARLVSSPDPRK